MKSATCFSLVCAAGLSCLHTNADTGSSAESAGQLSDVRLTGITTLTGEKRALLVIREPAEPGQTNRHQYSCILSEGQSSGPISVLHVDEKAGRVRIRERDHETELSFERNGFELAAASRAQASQGSSSSSDYAPPAYYAPYIAPPQPIIVQAAPPVCPPQSQVVVIGSGYRSHRSSSLHYYSSLPHRSFGYSVTPGFRHSYYRSYCGPSSVHRFASHRPYSFSSHRSFPAHRTGPVLIGRGGSARHIGWRR